MRGPMREPTKDALRLERDTYAETMHELSVQLMAAKDEARQMRARCALLESCNESQREQWTVAHGSADRWRAIALAALLILFPLGYVMGSLL